MRQRQSLSFSSSSTAFSTSAHGIGRQTAQSVDPDVRTAIDDSHDGPTKGARSERSRQKPATVAPSAPARRTAKSVSAKSTLASPGAPASVLDELALSDLSAVGVVALQPPQPQIQIQPFASAAAFVRSIEQRVHLPETFEGFIIYCAGLILVVLGMTLHISLSAEILQAEVRVYELQSEYERIGQQNSELIWQIARESSLERLQHRVAGLGYAPITEREYVPVVVEGTPMASTAAAAATVDVAPKLDLMEQLRAYFGGGSDRTLPNGSSLSAPASVRFVGSESGEAVPPTSAPAEWWSNVWNSTLERGEKSLEWLTGIE